MNYKEFLMQYNGKKTDESKDACLRSHIKTSYVPFFEKLAIANSVVRDTMEEKVEGTNERIFKMNTPLRFFLTVINVIRKYTDIEWGENESPAMFDEFNKLGIIDALLISDETEDSPIPQKEYAELNRLIAMAVDDYMENNRSVTGFFETKIKALNLSLDTILSSLTDLVNQTSEQADIVEFPVDNKEE